MSIPAMHQVHALQASHVFKPHTESGINAVHSTTTCPTVKTSPATDNIHTLPAQKDNIHTLPAHQQYRQLHILPARQDNIHTLPAQKDNIHTLPAQQQTTSYPASPAGQHPYPTNPATASIHTLPAQKTSVPYQPRNRQHWYPTSPATDMHALPAQQQTTSIPYQPSKQATSGISILYQPSNRRHPCLTFLEMCSPQCIDQWGLAHIRYTYYQQIVVRSLQETREIHCHSFHIVRKPTAGSEKASLVHLV